MSFVFARNGLTAQATSTRPVSRKARKYVRPPERSTKATASGDAPAARIRSRKQADIRSGCASHAACIVGRKSSGGFQTAAATTGAGAAPDAVATRRKSGERIMLVLERFEIRGNTIAVHARRLESERARRFRPPPSPQPVLPARRRE